MGRGGVRTEGRIERRDGGEKGKKNPPSEKRVVCYVYACGGNLREREGEVIVTEKWDTAHPNVRDGYPKMGKKRRWGKGRTIVTSYCL